MDEEQLNKIVTDMFAQADTDKSGFIERNELAALAKSMPLGNGGDSRPPTEAEIDEQMKMLDTNKDGKISPDELKAFFKALFEAMFKAVEGL